MTYIGNLIYGLTDAVSEITGIQLITFLQKARITVLHKTVRYYKYFKSEQRSALLAKSGACNRLQPAQEALAPRGFSGSYNSH